MLAAGKNVGVLALAQIKQIAGVKHAKTRLRQSGLIAMLKTELVI
jgi:hypothetical protein